MNIKATILLMAVIGSSAMGMNKRKAEDQDQGSNKKQAFSAQAAPVQNQQAPLLPNIPFTYILKKNRRFSEKGSYFILKAMHEERSKKSMSLRIVNGN